MTSQQRGGATYFEVDPWAEELSAWQCSGCEFVWIFDEEGPPSDSGWRYCPRCWRSIIREVRGYIEDEDNRADEGMASAIGLGDAGAPGEEPY